MTSKYAKRVMIKKMHNDVTCSHSERGSVISDCLVTVAVI